jgi:predicted ATPase
MAELPTGTVTFLFTDIEGSTKLLHELGDGYADALDEHRRILRAAFVAHDGVEVDTQGDAFFVAFAKATDAAAAAAEGQRSLTEGPIRVRMGIHTGSLNRSNLPVTATDLVGRDQELTELCGLLADGSRLVTLTGAGGSGKTRLALQVAAELSDDFGDGVFFVPLAPVQDPELVAPTIAQTAELRDVRELHEAEALLVLDNFEHLLDAAAQVRALLQDAPRVRMLATSRAPLRVSGEHEYALDPLPEDEAVELFLQRARAVKRDVVLEDSVVEICRRLDGLPLALELAASRMKVLDPAHLLERLDRRLPLLTGGARDAPERQQTLRATIEWSYDLLQEPLQTALRRLSVFAGSFSLEAAESVTETDLDELAALVDWSLVKPIAGGRFFMLETIREYALERLERDDEPSRLRDMHLAHYLALAEEAEPNLTGPDQAEWYALLAVEHDNIREALAYACATDDGERALMLAGSIWRFWVNRVQVVEASLWYDRAFEVGDDASPRARARGLFGTAHMAEARRDAALARKQFEEAVDLFPTEDTRWKVLALTHMAVNHVEDGEFEPGERLNREALELAVETGDVRGQAVVKANMAFQQMVEGNDAAAEELLEQSGALLKEVGDVYGVATTLSDSALLALRRGDAEAAAVNIRESLRLSRSIGDELTGVHTLSLAAALAFARERDVACARLYGAVRAICDEHGFDLFQLESKLMNDTLDAVRDRLGDRFEAEWAAGSELEPEAAAELALASID